MRFSPLLMGRLSAGIKNAVGKKYVSLMPFDILICHFPGLLSTTPSHGVLASVPWERNGFL